MLIRQLILIFLILIASNMCMKAAHIIGGVMSYEYISTENNINTYKITLRVFRDCNPFTTGADFDKPAPISIGKSDFTYFNKNVSFGNPVVTTISNQFTNFCLALPPNVCVQQGVYTKLVKLPIEDNLSYFIIYQRCCRNNTIFNILAPGDRGATFMIEITPEAQKLNNSSPTFKNFPPIAICGNYALNFDHSAIDIDGDSLVYSLTAPLEGGGKDMDMSCTSISPIPACLPPYESVSYRNPFNINNPIGGSPGLSLNKETGLMLGNPDILGQFVVGVMVKEYRNGVLLSTTIRDFQFNITQCEKTVNALLEIDDTQGKDLELTVCGGKTFDIENKSSLASSILSYDWEFEHDGKKLTSQDKNITLQTPEPGIYTGRLIVNQGLECTDTANYVINRLPELTADFDADFDPCERTGIQFTDKSTTETGIDYTHSWTSNGMEFSTSSNPLLNLLTVGDKKFTLIIKDINNCIDSTTHFVDYIQSPDYDLVFAPSLTGCANALITMNHLDPLDAELQKIDWDFGDGAKGEGPVPQHIYASQGDYDISVKITHSLGCIYEKTFRNVIHIKESPVAAFDFNPKELSNLSAKISINDLSKDAIKWLYDFGEGEFSILTEPIYEYKDTGIYTIYQKVTNQFGCIDTAFAIVDVKPIYTIFLPNAFIAGSNSINGSYGAVGIPFGLREFEMRIYDRWGNEVFHSNDFNQKWDGNNSDGQPAANGVYAVLVRLTGARGATETIRGQAVLLK